MDETSQKIIDATMTLIRDKGYVATTTKDIAKLAGVNECTLFRKFGSKKDIALTGIGQEKWRGNISRDIFQDVVWELHPDLEMFMRLIWNGLRQISSIFPSACARRSFTKRRPLIL